MDRPARVIFPLILGAYLVLGATAGCRCRQEPSPSPGSTPPAGQQSSPGAASGLPLPIYAKYLSAMRICLDPGHGGDANRGPNYKRGPTGLREAEVNLRVALTLRDLLEASGAVVFMTRTTDTCLSGDDQEDLRLRAEVANRNDCDLLLSIHHNAGERAQANYTSVWYHGDVDWSPASLDVARELAAALLDELRLPEQLGLPVLSDQSIYARTGFAVLRLSHVPAVLSEASFHTNPAEEQRLRDPEYNRREARALFTGLARYALGGVPRVRVVQPADGRVPASGRQVILEIDDGLRSRQKGHDRRLIVKDSIIIRLGKDRWPFDYDEKLDRLTFSLPTYRQPGQLVLGVQFENLFKHSNTRPWLGLRVEAR